MAVLSEAASQRARLRDWQAADEPAGVMQYAMEWERDGKIVTPETIPTIFILKDNTKDYKAENIVYDLINQRLNPDHYNHSCRAPGSRRRRNHGDDVELSCLSSLDLIFDLRFGRV